MRKNYIEVPKKVYCPDMNRWRSISFARTKKDLNDEIYETLELPKWLDECIEEYAQEVAREKVKEFKSQIKSLFT